VGSPDPPPPYRIRRVFPQLKLDQPLYLIAEPGTDRLFVVEREGKIRTFSDQPNPQQADLFLDTKQQTYSMAFHPAYASNGFVYVFTNDSKVKPEKNRVTRFQATGEQPRRCKPDSAQRIIEWDSNGHDGGCLAFGPDGKLYVSVGDGTTGSDPLETGQDLRDLLASMLRMDVDHPDPGKAYGIPPDNPFLRLAGARPEIWAYGLRNPWRFSFDRETGNLWLGDVGQDLWEMIHLISRGGNHGWSVREGSHPFQLQRQRGPTPIMPPIVEHPHSEARSIIGGLVYHGSRLKELQGAYIYGDHETGKVWGLRYDGHKVTWHKELANSQLKIVAFGENHAGELHIVSLSGELHELEPAPADAARPPFPQRLSDTGLFASVKDHQPAPGLIPYSVNSPLWADNAYKERFLALPSLSTITFPAGTDDSLAWELPEGSVLVKTFALDMEEGKPASRRRLETRLITRQQGQWHGYTYLWNDEQTEAMLAPASGLDRTYTIIDAAAPGGERKQTWHYPSRDECMVCHTRAAGFLLGINTPQMNKVHNYGAVSDNQLRTLDHLGVFAGKPTSGEPATPESLARLPDPADESCGLEARARSYLHANCSHCHVTDGGGNARMELRFATESAKMGIIGVRPQHETQGLADAFLVAPGDPDRSLVYVRATKRGTGGMPPLGTSLPDPQGTKLLRDWIKQLKK
jgi:uncharacterized repeat protein (TIGR03806 family)